MADTDPDLGLLIHGKLVAKGIETPMVARDHTTLGVQTEMAIAFQKIMTHLSLNLEDDSLKDTPNRVSKMYAQEIFYGLDHCNFPKCTVIENKMGYDEVIISDGIEVLSCCEHHFVPFIGTAHIGYIPSTKVLGLSKFNRVVDYFARRPQVQERLTEQVHCALSTILGTENVGVVIRAQHLCVKMRGVKDGDTTTVTSKLTGRFRESESLRLEFMSLIGRK